MWSPGLSPEHNLLPSRILLPIQTPNNQQSSVSPTTRATSYPGFARACAADPFPSADHAPLRALSTVSVTEPNTRVKDRSQKQTVIAGGGRGEDYRSIQEISLAMKRSD